MRPSRLPPPNTEPQQTNTEKEKPMLEETERAPKRAPQPSDYMDDIKAEEGFENITDAQAAEYLQVMFDMMKGFVGIGYGLEPVQKLIADFETSANDARILVTSKDAQDEK